MGRILRRLAGALLLAALACGTASAFPDKPVTLLVPQPPGGANDALVRAIAQRLQAAWGQSVVVDFRPGGGVIVGTQALARSPADGYTLGLITSGHSLNQALRTDLPYDSVKDFAPVARIGYYVMALVAVPAFEANDVKGLVALAKQKPGSVQYASLGIGGATHLAGELLKLQTGTQIKHVPYKGSAQALTDLMGGHIQLVIDGFNVVQPSVASGKARAIAITSDTRSPAMPHVPTMKEAGLGDLVIYGWQGVLAPASTPSAIIEKLTQEVAKALANPALKARLSGQGTEPSYLNPAQFRSYITGEQARWANVISSAKITLD